jgi:hypothetical protein
MAFSPFHWFRKHQKVFFAVLTVLCMFVFIGQAGSGADIFQTILGWMGAGRYAHDTLITLNGKKVTDQSIDALVRKRKLANDFLFETAIRSHPRAIDELLKDRAIADNALVGVQNLLQSARQRTPNALAFMILRIQQQQPEQVMAYLAQIRAQIQNELREIESISDRDKVKNDPERLAILRRIATIFAFQYWIAEHPDALSSLFRQQFKPEDFYFGGSARADRRSDDALDFMLWQNQADRLGISLTDADLVQELTREAADQIVFNEKVKDPEKDKQLVEFVKHREYGVRTTPRDLLDALREEFRVVMAQGLLLGAGEGSRGYGGIVGTTRSPAVGTPDQFLRFFREQRTTLRVKMLTVPVSRFIDLVKAQPTEEELRNRFKEGRTKEPSPDLREPGFKEPRRIAVEYVSASTSDPFYRGAAKNYTDPRTQTVSTVGLLALAPVMGPCALPAIVIDPYKVEYDSFLKKEPAWVSPDGDDSFGQPIAVHMSSVLRPANIAATVGSLLASAQGGQNALGAPITLCSTSAFAETREKLKLNLTMLLARANSPGSSFSDRGANTQNPLSWALLTMPLLPNAPPLATLKPQLQSAMEKRVAEQVLQENLRKVQDELRKVKGRDPAVIRKYIDTAVKDYQLVRKSMAKPLPMSAMIHQLNRNVDLNLGPLQEAYLAQMRFHKIDDFARTLYMPTGAYDAQQVSNSEAVIPREFLFWRTEDLRARERLFSEVRDEVVDAWRFEEARKLARREAERLEAKINEDKRPPDVERFLREQEPKLGELFELNNIAQLVPPTREVFPLRPTEYVSYSVPSSQFNQLSYPPAEMVKHLLSLKRPGEATVIADRPAKNFYVVVLFDRDVPTVKQFEELYKKPTAEATLYNNYFAPEQRDEYQKAVVRQLRAEAGKVDKDGRFVLPDSYRKRADGSGRDDE